MLSILHSQNNTFESVICLKWVRTQEGSQYVVMSESERPWTIEFSYERGDIGKKNILLAPKFWNIIYYLLLFIIGRL